MERVIIELTVDGENLTNESVRETVCNVLAEHLNRNLKNDYGRECKVNDIHLSINGYGGLSADLTE